MRKKATWKPAKLRPLPPPLTAGYISVEVDRARSQMKSIDSATDGYVRSPSKVHGEVIGEQALNDGFTESQLLDAIDRSMRSCTVEEFLRRNRHPGDTEIKVSSAALNAIYNPQFD